VNNSLNYNSYINCTTTLTNHRYNNNGCSFDEEVFTSQKEKAMLMETDTNTNTNTNPN
jgi:hypothetical protein